MPASFSDDLLRLQQSTMAIRPLPLDAWTAFADLWSPVQMPRKALITAAGAPETYLYFVAEGIQRLYYYDDNHREATLLFTYAPSFGGVLDSFLLGSPARYYYESLTASRLLRAPRLALLDLMDEHPTIAALIREGVTAALAGVLERLTEMQCYSAADRFRMLLRRSPHLLGMIPHKYLANYLGLDATTFSKLLATVRI
jgi:CRP-like cAMP-binding protein